MVVADGSKGFSAGVAFIISRLAIELACLGPGIAIHLRRSHRLARRRALVGVISVGRFDFAGCPFGIDALAWWSGSCGDGRRGTIRRREPGRVTWELYV